MIPGATWHARSRRIAAAAPLWGLPGEVLGLSWGGVGGGGMSGGTGRGGGGRSGNATSDGQATLLMAIPSMNVVRLTYVPPSRKQDLVSKPEWWFKHPPPLSV